VCSQHSIAKKQITVAQNVCAIAMLSMQGQHVQIRMVQNAGMPQGQAARRLDTRTPGARLKSLCTSCGPRPGRPSMVGQRPVVQVLDALQGELGKLLEGGHGVPARSTLPRCNHQQQVLKFPP